jgi:hypothetical protein
MAAPAKAAEATKCVNRLRTSGLDVGRSQERRIECEEFLFSVVPAQGRDDNESQRLVVIAVAVAFWGGDITILIVVVLDRLAFGLL